jgi:hypothetical protein
VGELSCQQVDVLFQTSSARLIGCWAKLLKKPAALGAQRVGTRFCHGCNTRLNALEFMK